MDEKHIDDYRLISVSTLIRAIQDGKRNAERFCFIIGAGASESSGIPTGRTLEYNWMKEMEAEPGLEEIRGIATKLYKDGRLDHEFKEIEKAWEEAKTQGKSLSSKFYFDIYKLRFFPNHRNGYHYLENVMANKMPSFGYHPLALMLADGSGDNLVITTNFDSLIEDALFLYTKSKPLVINHELLADYAEDANIKRPIIAKIHRGIFFDPLNRPEDTDELKGRWHDVLASVFQNYTPIVIGYGGGDNSLMELLTEESVRMKNGIYWCYVEEYGIPNEKIQQLVQDKKGYLVRTAGFDATMLAIGNALFPDKIGVHETEEYLNNRTITQITNYEEKYKRLTELEKADNAVNKKRKTTQSEEDFLKEIEKMVDRGSASESERQKANQMTEWDYWRNGRRFYDAEEYEEAIKNYSQAIDMQPNIAVFYNDRAAAYNGIRDYEKVIVDCNWAIEFDSNMATAYGIRGYAYSELKEYEKAIADYNRAIELEPNGIENYNNRGYHYMKLKDYDKALADFDKAIEIDPDFANPYKHYGTVWKEKEDFQKAIEYYTKAITLYPQYKEAFAERAETYRLMGENEKAMEDEAVAEKL